MLVVLGVVLAALILFVTEYFPIDVTAILIMVSLILLEPWTRISPQEGISGFSNPATITVLAMLILSAGVSKTGFVQMVGGKMSSFAGTDRMKQLAATVGVAGPASGFVNNTPVVAVLVPVVSDLAHKGKTSPSKLLIPLSFASMLGGTLTLIGTSTNILASDIAARLSAEHPSLHAFSMFEFTSLGIVVVIVGSAYLLTVGYRLLPERVPPEEDYIEEYEIEDYLTEVVVPDDSPITGMTVDEVLESGDFDVDVLQVVRDGEEFDEPLARKTVRGDDILRVRTDRKTLEEFVEEDDLRLRGEPDEEDIVPEDAPTLVEVVVPSNSFLVGETLTSSNFRERYDANVLAFRSRGETLRSSLEDVKIRSGDTLLLQAPSDTLDRLVRNTDFIVAQQVGDPDYRKEKIPVALGIIAGVVLLPALGVLPILVSALAGVAATVVLGVIPPNEMYDAVDWDVIFLLAGVIPLGIALEQTGAADLIGALVASTETFLPTIGVLWVFYVSTALLTNVVSNNASVVLMIPVAAEAASRVGANPFAFVLAVTFAASTAFMTPVGYQTNLLVYGPGGYKFSDFVRVGAPLQALLS
ncbi:MAG: SLC13 family permease, partial [Halobacteria archaeon]|nr:SLC13 family permease [Halobacteria archaeon]